MLFIKPQNMDETMSEGTYDNDLTPSQEYLIAGIVITLFGLLYWFLNHQWDSDSNIQIASSEVVDIHKKADFSAEPATPTQKVKEASTSPASSQGIDVGVQQQQDVIDASTSTNPNVAADFQVKAPLSESGTPESTKPQQAFEETPATGNTDKAVFVEMPEKQPETHVVEKGNRYSLPDGTEITIASEGFENDLRNTLESNASNKLLFDNVYFKSGSATIDETSIQQIKATAALLNTYPERKILLRGHTDNSGEQGRNIQLSLARANEMGLALGRLGIKLERIQIIGVGDAEPIADNDTEDGRRQNRRIEILLLN